MEEEVEVPHYFLCPISMQLMRDPVITSSGITYDRENIEKWLIKCNHTTCPMTKQELSTIDLIPNITLHRLIHSWCIMNSSNGVERIPTPKPHFTKPHVLKILRSIGHANESNKKCLESLVAIDFFVSIVNKGYGEQGVSSDAASPENSKILRTTLDILFHLNPSNNDLEKFISEDDLLLDSLMHFLKCGNNQFQGYAMKLLKSSFKVVDQGKLSGVKQEYFKEILLVLKNNNSHQSNKASLELLIELCPLGRNRIKAIEVGAIYTLIELLLDHTIERRCCELILIVLHQLCSCAEGRAKLLSHGAGLTIVSKKILRISQMASDKGVRILCSILKFSATSRVLHEMLQIGAVTKLCLVLQVESSRKTKERAKEVLRLHSRVWRDSPCIPPHLLSSYPT